MVGTPSVLQRTVNENVFRIKKLDGKTKTADLGTKDLNESDMRKCLKTLGVMEAAGQHPLTLRAAV